ncbi:MAG: restriction endonuclease subunit S [Selenomonadaceae bacterium]|nr:restriction endonuclease subunit S [Selenomonadaceae bacterium]
MAKKKQDLSPEERLAAALVPEEEWPYALPDGWKWVRLGKIYEVNPKIQADDNIEASFITMSDICPGIKSQFDFSIKKWGEIKKGHTQFANGDVAFAKISPCFENRKSMILDGLKNGIGAGTTELIVLRNPQIDNNYTFLFISSEEFIRHARNTYKGVVGQQRINLDFVKNYPMPLPPLSEQHRLVARIESLFAKLDAAREKVQSVLNSHETRKAALLHDAFTGKLTAKWREEHKFSYNEWHLVCIKDICHSLKYGTAKKSEASGRYVVIRMGNLFDGEILWDNLAYSNDNEDIEKYQLTPGDVLFNRTNSAALVGKTSIYRGDYPAIYAGYIIKLDYDRKTIDGEFLNYIMNSPCAKTYCNKVKTDGVNQSNINAKKIGAFQFKLPSLPEQQEIIRILDRLLAREQRARQAAEETLTVIDRMKQSILARAFRGEL